MLQRLQALFGEGKRKPTGAGGRRHDQQELQLAVAVLLVEAARMDGTFDADERRTIRDLIVRRLELGEADAEALIDAAVEMAQHAGELWSFARVVKNSFDYEERVEIIEMLWEVVWADGTLHDHEAALLRRITGLIYVSDRDSGMARKRVLDRLGLGDR